MWLSQQFFLIWVMPLSIATITAYLGFCWKSKKAPVLSNAVVILLGVYGIVSGVKYCLCDIWAPAGDQEPGSALFLIVIGLVVLLWISVQNVAGVFLGKFFKNETDRPKWEP